MNPYLLRKQCYCSNIHTLQVFILSFEDLKVFQCFLVRVLHLEELGAERARLLLGSIQLSLTLLILLLPLGQNLRKTKKNISLDKNGCPTSILL